MHSLADIIRELNLDLAVGLDDVAIARSRAKFGANTLQPLPREAAWKKFISKFDEPIIRILLGAALLQLVVDLFDPARGGSNRLGGLALGLVVLLGFAGLLAPAARKWLPAFSFVVAGVLAVISAAWAGHVPAEGLAVMIAVALATGVSFFSEYKSDREFELLNARTADRTVKALRNGLPQSVLLEDVVVGDVLLVEGGDEFPADGSVVSAADLHVDQSLLTGESEPVEKLVGNGTTEGPEQSGCVFRGTQVVQGVGRVVIAAVGDATQLGQLAKSLSDNPDEPAARVRRRLNVERELTPLQHKLEKLAGLISTVGYVAAVAVFIAFIGADLYHGRIVWPFANGEVQSDLLRASLGEILQAFVVMVVIIVVAVPEGLPMSVTVSLALAMRKMTRAKSLVRQMVACETIGSATVICTDKTGTLTQNKMRVVAVGWVGGLVEGDAARQLAPRLPASQPADWIALIAAVNSTAHLEEKDGQLVPLGNPTEAALLLWLIDCGGYAKIRNGAVIRNQFHFSSERKRMSTVVEVDGQPLVLVKGAPEWLLANSTHYLDEAGLEKPWDDAARRAVTDAIGTATGRAMRTLAFGYQRRSLCLSSPAERPPQLSSPFPPPSGPLPPCGGGLGWGVEPSRASTPHPSPPPQGGRGPEGGGREQNGLESPLELGPDQSNHPDDLETNLVYVGHVAIRDPLRDEVPGAVAQCRSAGIEVIMITGDNPQTARSIAADVGLLDTPDAVLLTSDEFNALSDDEVTALLPRFRVLARAKPLDKLRLVLLLQARGEVVAMTGDGTNDAPALKRADVGLSMGLSGTEVAKEASKIVLLDDSFATIVRAVHWGRALYENIQRFLQFQLTINVSALAIAFFGTLLGTQPPFTVLQMLWINVIMDTFAAIALCSEPPRRGLMQMRPKRRDESILTRSMMITIGATAAFFVVVMLGLLLGMKLQGWYGGDEASRIEPFTYRQATIFFTIYVFFQVWNQFNCRSLTPDVSVLHGLFRNPVFLAITALIVVGQISIVTFGGRVFNVRPLDLTEWLAIAGVTASVLVFGEVMRQFRRGK
ncbi:MAG: cation-translocating P-type ATPase [Gemmataceae bacterium]